MGTVTELRRKPWQGMQFFELARINAFIKMSGGQLPHSLVVEKYWREKRKADRTLRTTFHQRIADALKREEVRRLQAQEPPDT